MQRLGMYIKVFQFGVVLYDLLVLDIDNVMYNISGGMISTTDKTRQLAIGMLLIFVGQVLNYTTFQALGAKGVYYGYEFGYSVDRVTCFPYNLNINDPQYWGVVLCIFGIYMSVGASSFMIPGMELFWYMMSMKVLENERGVRWVNAFVGNQKKAAKRS
jgi:protein-S-isoprenylcysteine O-methyltransferase Ste14